MQAGYRAAKFLETRVPTPSPRAEGNTERYASASITRTLRGRRPPHAWKLLAREPGDPTSARHEIVSGPVGEGDEPQVQHERWWGVGRPCSTCEVPEQRWESAGEGCGGKTTDQREHGADDRVPDTELGQRDERPAPCAGSSKKGQTATVHCATAPRHDSSTTG